MKEKQSFIVYYEWEEMLQFMSDSQIAELLRAIFAYAKRGEPPKFSTPLLNTTFCVIKFAIDRDKEKYMQRSAINSLNGQKGGRPTTSKSEKKQMKAKKADNDNVKDNDNDNENDNENDNVKDNDNNLLSISSSPAVKDRATEGAYTDDFLAFWEEYPRKTGKGAAFRVWLRIRPSKKERADISSALKWQKQSLQWNDNGYGKFIPLPATYLNQRRWEDEPDATGNLSISTPDKYLDDENDMKALKFLEEYNNGK